MRDKSIRKKHSSNGGFTLVELVVVLVILAILADILTPALLGYIDSARKEEELTHAKALLNATRSKLVSLYDRGEMPNVDAGGNGDQSGTGGFFWNREWSDDCFYVAGLENKPYVCGFACGQLCSAKPKTYLKNGLSGLKKGYNIYVFFYMEKADSSPAFYYNGDWSYDSPSIGDADGAFHSEIENQDVFLSSWYVPYGCEGTEDASQAWSIAVNAIDKQ
ncbi:MAG: prepilin-type N-terminal cleavage/methylation domain-containing protein [Lachnospiraceae bacterium]|nr:prepilin-type N-terminal cleavage/methylation domain-containing protein [Lachnospiraceae bacterium]